AEVNRLAIVVNLVGFSVHQSAGALDDSAEAVADALVAEADAEDGDFGGKMLDDVVGDAAFFGRARAGGNDDVRGAKVLNFRNRHLVVAKDLHRTLGVDLAQPLNEVVSEGVVVIDQNNHDKSVRAREEKVKRHSGAASRTLQFRPCWRLAILASLARFWWGGSFPSSCTNSPMASWPIGAAITPSASAAG